MQPYQRSSEKIRQGEEQPIHLLKNAGLTAVGAGIAKLGTQAASKLIPSIGSLINKYVPGNIMEAGLKKVDPRFGKFLEGAKDSGFSEDEIREFLESKVEKFAKDQRNIIEQESPELHKFLSMEISGGRTPIEAAAIAQNDKRFSNIIKKLTKDHKTDWSKIIESIFGSGQYGGAVNPSTQQGQPTQPVKTERQPFQGPGINQQPQGGQVGPGQQALMDVIAKINQKLGQ